MEIHSFIIHLLLFFHVIYLVSVQDLNIIKIGGANFANVNLFRESDITLMGTSGLPYSNEKILYDIGNSFSSFHNGTRFLHLSPKNSSDFNQNNYTYKNFSGQSIYYNGFWISVSGNDYLESYDLVTGEYYSIGLQYYFWYSNYVEFGSIVPFQTMKNDSYFEYIFPFIIEEANTTFFVLHAINPYSIFLFEPNAVRLEYIREISKGKVISCFSNQMPIKFLTCLYKSDKYYLEAIILNQYLEREGFNRLYQVENSTENENMFFKGITFKDNTSVVAYYMDYQDNYLRISLKKLDFDENNSPILANYSSNTTLIFDAGNFNKHYMLNDLVKLDNNDVYFAASSNDKETLYIIILKINGANMNKKLVTIELYKDYNHKFYKEMKLVNHLNSTIMGFSHCNSKKCEESSYHTTSLVSLNDLNSKYDFDLIKSLYDSNYNQSEPIIIDLNIYKNNILGLQFKYITFINIPSGLSLKNPKNNSDISEYITYDFSSFILNISLNATGKFNLVYSLTMDDSTSNSNLRRLVAEDKTVYFHLLIDKAVSTSCDDKCSLCSATDPTDCISCKYDYSFVGEKKYCFSENGDMNMSQIGDIYDTLKENLEDQNFITISKENAVFQMVTVEDQLNNNSQSISSVDLGECEELLREQEGIDDDEQFIIIKMDLKNNSVSATYVQYELYNPRTLKQVSMDICKNIPIKILTPVSLSESKYSLISSLENSGYNAFDINDDFYNDICSTYTAENGADIVLSLRKSLIYDQNKEIYLCQSGCEFGNFNTQNGRAECNCKVQSTNTVTDITKITFDKTRFVDSFYKTLYNSNFRVMKCASLVFSSKGLKNNFGCYLMTILLGLFIGFIVLYLLTGPKKITEIINIALKSNNAEINKDNLKELIKESRAIEEKKEEKKEDKKEDNKEEKKEDKKEDNKEEKKEDKKEKNEEIDGKEVDIKPAKRKSIKKKSTKRRKSKDKIKKNEEPQYPPKKRKSRKSKELKIDNLEGRVVNTKANLEENKEEIKETNIKEEKEEKKHKHRLRHSKNLEKQKLELAKGLNDQELNTLDYEVAIVIDNRTYFQYYFSLIKKKHLILFTFLPQEDYNLMPMKILLFIVSFSLYFTINGFFFTDKTMNKIYKDDGVFNFVYQLPQIIYSSLIPIIINMLLKMLSLSEKKVLEIKKEKSLDKAKIKANKIKKELNITLIIFLALSSVLMLFFWYFISCFCAVYENTQTTLIVDTLISFAISMLYPFILNLLPGAIRIPALRAPKKDKNYRYKISLYAAMI